jgi:hypothetical protein
VTLEQAKFAMTLAPADDQLSAVEPNMTRRNVVYLMREQLNHVPPTFIDLTPHVARKVAMVLQDCTDPVSLHFLNDKNGQITVGWNREEVEIRKGLRPRPRLVNESPVLAKIHHSELHEYFRKEREAIRQQLAMAGLSPLNTKPLKPAPAPPKPDPTDPRFVLKRPKL